MFYYIYALPRHFDHFHRHSELVEDACMFDSGLIETQGSRAADRYSPRQGLASYLKDVAENERSLHSGQDDTETGRRDRGGSE